MRGHKCNIYINCIPHKCSLYIFVLLRFHYYRPTYTLKNSGMVFFLFAMFSICPSFLIHVIIPPEQQSCWGVYWFYSVRPSVRLSRLPCPLCNIYSSGWILSILATNDHYHERVCRTQWPLTLTYIFKVIRPWIRKSCPLCSVWIFGKFLKIFGLDLEKKIYSSQWILSIFRTNDH